MFLSILIIISLKRKNHLGILGDFLAFISNYADYFLLYDFIFYLYISIKFVLKQIFENFIMLFYILYHSKSKIVIFTDDFFHLILN